MTETEIQTFLMQRLQTQFGDPEELYERTSMFNLDPKYGSYHCISEGTLDYILPNGTTLTHRNDILITGEENQIAIEIKHTSSVTDQFKTRSYDALHIKKSHPKTTQVMLYIRHNRGISPEHAEKICYPFDHFIYIDFKELSNEDSLKPLLTVIEKTLTRG